MTRSTGSTTRRIEAYLEQIAAEPKIDWYEGDPPPPWKPPTRGNNHYRWAMIDFVEWQLDQPIARTRPDANHPPDVYKRALRVADGVAEEPRPGDRRPPSAATSSRCGRSSRTSPSFSTFLSGSASEASAAPVCRG